MSGSSFQRCFYIFHMKPEKKCTEEGLTIFVTSGFLEHGPNLWFHLSFPHFELKHLAKFYETHDDTMAISYDKTKKSPATLQKTYIDMENDPEPSS